MTPLSREIVSVLPDRAIATRAWTAGEYWLASDDTQYADDGTGAVRAQPESVPATSAVTIADTRSRIGTCRYVTPIIKRIYAARMSKEQQVFVE
jgi:hypothetical protein